MKLHGSGTIEFPTGDRMKEVSGLVSQSGGVPNGAIIERGSNANGEYVKFADGTLICTLYKTSNTQAFIMYTGAVFYSDYTWTFPHAFVGDMPVATCSKFKWGSSGSWGSVAFDTLLNATLRGYDVAARASGTDTLISAMAIGRWY